MKYFLVLLVLFCVISNSAKADNISVSIGTGRDFLDQCEVLIINGKANNTADAMRGSFCIGYVNGLAQVLCDKSYDGKSMGDIGLSYIAYLKLHPKDQDQDNSILFKRMVKHGS